MKEVWYSFARDPLINFANKSHELEGHRVEMAQRAFYLLLAQDPRSVIIPNLLPSLLSFLGWYMHERRKVSEMPRRW